jgi:hypothetical protein
VPLAANSDANSGDGTPAWTQALGCDGVHALGCAACAQPCRSRGLCRRHEGVGAGLASDLFGARVRCGLVCDLTRQPSWTKALDLSKSLSVITRLNSQSLETPEFRQSAVSPRRIHVSVYAGTVEEDHRCLVVPLSRE